ncbi:MAG TPA: alpha/beta fold hydrolase [Pseudomonadaceae bacterium]|nr:alpha/beta fold hydrolase [Pseudomonadaceae bacterium]
MLRKLLWWVPLGLLLLLLIAGLLLSRGKILTERHQVFEGPAFDYTSGSFSDYIAYSRQRLQAARIGATSAEQLEQLLPFELPPASGCGTNDGKAAQGIVLTHGLFDSAYSMRDVGSFLQSRCFHVLGVLLPAHGTRPGDFLDTQWQDWAETVHFATQALSERVHQVYLGGHSAGATLSLLEAADNPLVEGLVLFGPALGITDAARYARYVVPIGRLFPKAAWVSIGADDAVYRYDSLTFSAAEQMQALIDALQEADTTRLQSLPVFSVVSMEDSTIKTPAVLDFMASNAHPASLTLLYSQQPLQNLQRTRVVSAADRSQGILSLGHLGLMTPPDHPWYGRDGSYRFCGHYGDADNPAFQRCKNGERDWYGETTPQNLQEGLLERIAFNPYYEEMLDALGQFLGGTAVVAQ